MTKLTSALLLAILPGLHGLAGDPPGPSAKALMERHAKEMAPVWTDGNTATFYFKGEAEQVTVIVGGERLTLKRLPDSDVWTRSVTRPDLDKGVFSYVITAEKKGDSPNFNFKDWRGPKAPPAPAKATTIKGTLKLVDFESKALGEKRKLGVYLPPGHDPSRRYPIVYATDGRAHGDLLEPLIDSGDVAPLIVVGASSGDYRGKAGAKYDIKNDLRAQEYVRGIDDERFAKHEKFFCEELRTWAEKELGASAKREDRAVFGCSNGARFAVEMGFAHPDLFGHVFAFSVSGSREPAPPKKATNPSRFVLAAGTWETGFHKVTATLAETLKANNIPVTFNSRVAGHDHAMWCDEFVAAVRRSFGKGKD